MPGLKRSKPSKSSTSPPNSAGKRYPNKLNTRHARRQQPPQGHSNGSRAPPAAMASYRRSSLPFATSNPPNPPKVHPAPQGKGTPTITTRATPARKSHHKATAMAEGHPPAAALAIRASYRRSRLPFARPQTLQTLQKSAQLRRDKVPQQTQHAPLPHAQATTRPQQWLKGTPRPQQWLLIGLQGCRLPGLKPSKRSKSPPTRATPAGNSHHKATAMAQGHPPAAAMASYRRSSLPFARPQTLQTLQKSSSAGKRYPNNPNTRHSPTQKPPQGHSNG